MSIPHSGEQIPPEVDWLSQYSEPQLMRDVDRFVDQLYRGVIEQESIPCVETPWHRYVIDLNRTPDQYDEDAVLGAKSPSGSFPKGLHWSRTTHDETLISQPMTPELHESLVANYYLPFHDQVSHMRKSLQEKWGQVFHLDLHSMPSLGTSFHPDPGQDRAEVVVSDFHGKSASPEFRDIVLKAYQEAGFQVAYNWPYIGGGITQRYGDPGAGFHTVQVELNRVLYMNESTKQKELDRWASVCDRLQKAVILVMKSLKELKDGK